MDNVIDQLTRIARACDRAAVPLSTDPVNAMIGKLYAACDQVGRAWSGSWLGYHAFVYTHGLHPRRPGQHFDIEWGSMRAGSEWAEYSFEAVENEIKRLAQVADYALLAAGATSAREAFEEHRENLLPTLDAILATTPDTKLEELRKEIVELKSHVTRETFLNPMQPKGKFFTHDSLAVSAGLQCPPHLRLQSWFFEMASHAVQLTELAKKTRYTIRYLERRLQMKGKSIAKKDGKIFLGHGRSLLWRELKDFLKDKLDLESVEFNSESAAGIATKERLETMLDESVFAFLVMTAEDSHADGAHHARENVIHESGLFQGRLGFRRAIVLLEEGCKEFSNIAGLGQIRFPKEQIKAAFEEIRDVLKREDIIG